MINGPLYGNAIVFKSILFSCSYSRNAYYVGYSLQNAGHIKSYYNYFARPVPWSCVIINEGCSSDEKRMYLYLDLTKKIAMVMKG